MPISLVIADDHPMILDGIERLFREEPDFELKARCVNGEEALREVRALRPDILVLDLKMPKMNGLEVLRELRREGLPTKVVMLAADLSDAEVLDAVSLSVRGVVLKDTAPEALVECVRRVHAGGSWLEDGAAMRALEHAAKLRIGQPDSDVLTAREVELVRLAAAGLRNKEIADRLSITEGTVKVHLHNVYQKLGVDGRVALLLRAEELGII
ncbi:MAG TPA: response regulator transcription factor [Thermoanaerobaculia bacterium]|nr:response regulator transcription factor [Thermoanaerobaculia bacterium]